MRISPECGFTCVGATCVRLTSARTRPWVRSPEYQHLHMVTSILVERYSVALADVMESRLHALLLPPPVHIAIAGTDGHLRVLDLETGAVQHVVRLSAAELGCVAYSPCGGHIAVAGERLLYDDRNSHIWILDARSGAIEVTVHAPDCLISSIAYSPCGERLAVLGGHRRMRILNLASGSVEVDETFWYPGLSSVSFAPDGGHLAVTQAGGHLHLLDSRTGSMEISIELRPFPRWTSHQPCDFYSAQYSPCGANIAVAGSDGAIRLLVASGERIRNSRRHDHDSIGTIQAVAYASYDHDAVGPILAVAYTPNGKRLVAACLNGLCFFDARHGQRQCYVGIPARDVSYTPDGESLIFIHDVTGLYAVDRPGVRRRAEYCGLACSVARVGHRPRFHREGCEKPRAIAL